MPTTRDIISGKGLAFISIIFVISLLNDVVHTGRPKDERLSMRLQDEQLRARNQQLDDEVDGDGRPRRQLPTEINIQVTAPLFTARLYDFGVSEGDKEVPQSIDVGIKYELKNPLTFYEQTFTDVFILSNGAIGFDANSRNFKPDVLKTGPMIIAPLWNRNDLRKGGKILFREVTEGRVIERAQSEVRYQYDKVIKPTSALLITWYNLQPMGDQTLSDDNVNTFQAAIISSDNGTFANFIYKNIGWTQGAEAGFSKGDGKNFYAMPTSGTSNIMYLKDYGNTGIPGEWIFEIGAKKLIRCKPGVKGDTCDDECADYEWGNDCELCCHCGKGRCNVATGECPGECKQCWKSRPYCDKRESDCRVKPKDCGYNAISFTDYDRCGEPVVRCQCLAGYVGDGFNCTDIDECVNATTCGPNANCFNTPGRFYCECQKGFTGKGSVCVPTGGAESSGGISLLSGRNSTAIPALNATTPVAVTPSTSTSTASSSTTSTSSSSSSATTTSSSTSTTTSSRSGASGTVGDTGLQFITAGTTSTTGSTTTKQEVDFDLSVTIVTRETTETPEVVTVKISNPESIESLPKEIYSQIPYRLRQPLTIFGKRRDRLTISSTGVVVLDDVPPISPEDNLDEIGAIGFAPFFGKIDLSQRLGSVTVRETSQSDVLTEATNMVEDFFKAPGFMAKSVVTIDFENVTSSAEEASSNSFKIMLTGGNNALGENVTYVEYVYDNLQWTDGAQAVILTDDVANNVQLPGSGSGGIRQLTQLSNINRPGQWMYRVDLDRVTCPQSNLLPPYCDSETPAPTTSALATSKATAAGTNATVSGRTERPVLATTQDISVTDFEEETVTFPAFVTVVPFLITASPNVSVAQPATIALQTPTVEAIVPSSELPAAEVPSPTTELTTETATVIPQQSGGIVSLTIPIGTSAAASLAPTPLPETVPPATQFPATVLSVSPNATAAPVPPAVPASVPPPQPPPATAAPATVQPLAPVPASVPPPLVPVPPSVPASIPPPPPPSFASALPPTVPEVSFAPAPPTLAAPVDTAQPPIPPEATVPQEAPAFSSPAPFPQPPAIPAGGLSAAPASPASPPAAPAAVSHTSFAASTAPPEVVTIAATVTPPPAVVLTNSSIAINADADADANATGSDQAAGELDGQSTPNLPPLHIFTTPRRQTRPPVPTRPPSRIVTATPPNLGGGNNGNRRPPVHVNNKNFDNIAGEEDDVDSLNSPSKLAIIIPTAIVGVWLLLLMIIGVVVCCRRRNGRKRVRSKYDPGFHFRHMPSISAVPRGTKDAVAVAAAAGSSTNGVYPQPHVTYEDHLEKAARLSEMSQYGPQNSGRVSVYGSYWNMPNSNRQYSYYNQGYYESCPEFNRSSYYNGRY